MFVVDAVTAEVAPPLTPGEGHGLLGVGDDQFTAGEGDGRGAFSQGLEGFAFACEADDDAATGEGVQVEGVGGLSEFEEDEVARIDDVVARNFFASFDAELDVLVAGGDGDTADDPGRVEGAGIGSLVDHLHVGFDGVIGLGHLVGRQTQGSAADGRDLAGESDVAGAVATVGHHLEVQCDLATVLTAFFQGEAGGSQQRSLLLLGGGGVEVIIHPSHGEEHAEGNDNPEPGWPARRPTSSHTLWS